MLRGMILSKNYSVKRHPLPMYRLIRYRLVYATAGAYRRGYRVNADADNQGFELGMPALETYRQQVVLLSEEVADLYAELRKMRQDRRKLVTLYDALSG